MNNEELLKYLRLKVGELEARIDELERKKELPTRRIPLAPVMMMMAIQNPEALRIFRTLSENPITSGYMADPLAPSLFDEEKLKKSFGSNDQFVDGDGETKWPMIVNYLIHDQIEKEVRPPDDPKILELKGLVQSIKERGEE